MLSTINRNACLLALVTFLLPALAAAQSASQTLGRAAGVLQDALGEASAETRELVDRAHCIHVVPAAGGEYRASGPIVCRSGGTLSGPWGPPAMMDLLAGDLAEYDSSTSFIVLFLSSNHVDDVLAGRDHSPTIAPGPDGHDDPPSVSDYDRVDLVSYAFTAGEFRGVELAGTGFGVDNAGNEGLYGPGAEINRIVRGESVEAPPSSRRLLDFLQTTSPTLRR